MIVQCPQCSTRFRLDARRLSDRGARVTCSVCSYGFVVHADDDDDVEALDPFASTKVDNPQQQSLSAPVSLEGDTTAHETLPPTFAFDTSPHDAKTAVHMVGPASRAPVPTTFDDVETLVDPPSRLSMTLDDVSAAVAPGLASHGGVAFPASHGMSLGNDFMNIDISDDTATAVTDDDVISIDDDDVVSIEDEPTIDHRGLMRESAAPQPMAGEISRSVTKVGQTPSLIAESLSAPPITLSAASGPGAQSLSNVPAFPDHITQARTSIIQVPSLTRPANEAHQQSAMLSAGGGMETFVGRIDPALMARAVPQQDDAELLMSGGLSSDGTFSPPQELTRPAINAFEGQTAVHNLELGRLEQRRETRPIRGGLGEGLTQDGVPRAAPPPEVTSATRFVRAATTVMLSLVLLGLAVFALVRSGQLDIEVLRDPERIVRGDGIEGASGILGVQPTSMRSVLYPTAYGKILVFTGEVKNTSTQPVSNLEIVAQVRKQDDTLLAEARGALGVVLSVAELARLETPDSARRAFAAKQNGPLTIAPGERLPFMVVVSPAPRELRSSRHRVHLVQTAPAVQVTAPARPAEPAQPAPPQVVAPNDDGSSKSPAVEHDLSQNKAKMKAKRTKMKRKARDADEDAPSEPAEQ